MNVMWNQVVEMPYIESTMTILDYGMDSKNSATILIQRSKEGNTKYFELLSYSESTKDVLVTNIEYNKTLKFSQNIFLVLLNEGQFYIVSFIGEGDVANGFYIGKFNSDGKVLNETVEEIPLKLINEFNTERFKNKNNKKIEKGEPVGIQGLSLTGFSMDAEKDLFF